MPGRLPYDKGLVSEVAGIAREADAFLLVGAAGYDKLRASQRKSKKVTTSAFLFSPEGRMMGRYDKMRLLPFDQYLPLREYVKWPSWVVPSESFDEEVGLSMTVFRTDRAAFGVRICWENLFADEFREMVKQGVDFMVSMTNEYFTSSPAARRQLLAMNVMRAIEHHVPVVRVAATGVSCIIAPDGRIAAKVTGDEGGDVNVEGSVVASISLAAARTFYTRYGDVFVLLAALTVLGCGAVVVSRMRLSGSGRAAAVSCPVATGVDERARS